MHSKYPPVTGGSAKVPTRASESLKRVESRRSNSLQNPRKISLQTARKTSVSRKTSISSTGRRFSYMENFEDWDFLFKIIIIGDSGVGKSNLLSRFAKDTFEAQCKPTIGVEFYNKTIELENSVIKAQIWDTAGQERFKSVTSAYYRGAVGCLVVYDVTKFLSFQHVDQWVQDIVDYSASSEENPCKIILVGNKTDLNSFRAVSRKEGQVKAQQLNVSFIETSALNGENVNEAFKMLITDIYNDLSLNQWHQKNARLSKQMKIISQGIELDYQQAKQQKQAGCC